MIGIERSEYLGRRERVRQAMAGEGLDALLVFSTAKIQANVRYLTSYYVRFSGMQSRPDGTYYMFGSSSVLLPLDGEPVVRTDQPWDVARCREMSIYEDTGFSDHIGAEFGALLRDKRLRRVGIDNWHLFPAAEYQLLREQVPDVEFVPTQLMSEVRRVKSPAEIELMREAARVGVAATEKALEAVAVGASEFEVQLLCEYEMRSGGDLHGSSESIGGCGPNTATGSFVPSRYDDRVMQPGEWVMLDVCPRVEGYCSDISRHRLVGDLSDLDPRLRRMYETTLLMNAEVVKAVRPGISGRTLNELATEIAQQEGFGQYKIDLLGHGVGIDIHDVPDFYHDASPLQAGEVITVEPCLLIPGVAGTRIEDTVLVTDDGAEILTESWRGLTPP